MGRLSDSEQSEWDALFARAMLSLDDDGAAQAERRAKVAAKKLVRMGLSEPPVDVALVRRTLIEYARTKRYLLALESTGATKDEMNFAYDLCADAKTVYDYVQRMRDRARAQELEEHVDLATSDLKMLLNDKDGKIGVNPKLVMETLARLDRGNFGDDAPPDARRDGERGDPIVYQITNVQVTNVGNDALRAALPAAGGAVDVDAVIRALDCGADG